jgi:hypothetical protein
MRPVAHAHQDRITPKARPPDDWLQGVAPHTRHIGVRIDRRMHTPCQPISRHKRRTQCQVNNPQRATVPVRVGRWSDVDLDGQPILLRKDDDRRSNRKVLKTDARAIKDGDLAG